MFIFLYACGSMVFFIFCGSISARCAEIEPQFKAQYHSAEG
jgi:hypothetical protein